MKFITEMELRDLYKTEPFTTYVLEPHVRITPGARQFLVDRGVKLVQTQSSNDINNENKHKIKTDQGRRKSGNAQRLAGRMEYVESLFLLVGAELLTCGDSILADEVMELGKYFNNLKCAEREQTVLDKIKFWDWPEEQINNCSNNLGKYFDINEFHVRLENGKTIALLNHLRASLREVEPAILETYWNEDQQACSREDLIEKVNLIINILCIMMWKCLGGQKCKP
jgi:Ethanolamine utilization cobalamin adenosyltransferase